MARGPDRRSGGGSSLTPASWAAFQGSYYVIEFYETNRTETGFYLGMVGYAAAVVALIATTVVVVRHPWRSGTTRQWLGLAAHGLALAIVIRSASWWMGRHIA